MTADFRDTICLLSGQLRAAIEDQEDRYLAIPALPAPSCSGLQIAHLGFVDFLLAWTFFGAERAPSVVRSRPGFGWFHYLFWPLLVTAEKPLLPILSRRGEGTDLPALFV